ncbi:hypothetical protein [Amycolatopsis jiangsuensis]|uniref:Putative membrane protein n=1 Tax=Amycolatopsis jiangsuensis TaxID=1181879 RepID=A0A840ITB0_9PSEU|nr:hypothetical protein [Amycolatopsis jiangsuensis]MBB4684452.1 putative membrane protein [Amycolatopsis jiangsuensis]
MTPRTTIAVSAALLVLTLVTAALAVTGLTGPVRLCVTLLFFLAVPGWSVVAFFRPGTSSLTWALVLATSVALDLLGGELMLLTQWQPAVASAAVLGVCGVLLVVHLATARRPALSMLSRGGGR